jgi:hypothetical protein
MRWERAGHGGWSGLLPAVGRIELRQGESGTWSLSIDGHLLGASWASAEEAKAFVVHSHEGAKTDPRWVED